MAQPKLDGEHSVAAKPALRVMKQQKSTTEEFKPLQTGSTRNVNSCMGYQPSMPHFGEHLSIIDETITSTHFSMGKKKQSADASSKPAQNMMKVAARSQGLKKQHITISNENLNSDLLLESVPAAKLKRRFKSAARRRPGFLNEYGFGVLGITEIQESGNIMSKAAKKAGQ